MVKCGKEKAESLVQANTTDPVWNFSAIFYRSRPEKDALKIQVGLASGSLYVFSVANYGRQQTRINTGTFFIPKTDNIFTHSSSVSDPDSLIPDLDPDPALRQNRIWILSESRVFMAGSGSRVFMNKN